MAEVETQVAGSEKQAASGERTAAVPEPVGTPGPVPYARFQEVIGERNKLRLELETAAAVSKQALERARELEEENGQARLKVCKYQVAIAAGLPLALAERLTGSDEAALMADAAALSRLVKSAVPGVPPTPGTAAATIKLEDMTPEQIRNLSAAEKKRIMRGTV